MKVKRSDQKSGVPFCACQKGIIIIKSNTSRKKEKSTKTRERKEAANYTSKPILNFDVDLQTCSSRQKKTELFVRNISVIFGHTYFQMKYDRDEADGDAPFVVHLKN